MSRGRRLAFAVAVAAQLAVTLGLAGLAAADLAFGREIKLAAAPVDPLDVFRGNYVVLRYDVSTLRAPFDVEPGDPLCASLYESGDTWRVSSVSDVPLGDVALCGTARRAATAGSEVEVEYGIETYYASRERAQTLERSIARGDLKVVVDLDDDGRARIERLEVEE
jgi:uncharacterized membrane-anchored protein